MSHQTFHHRAVAKINLHLRVLRKRPDGFHDMVSWMQPLDWYDELTLRESDASGVQWHCDDPRLGPSENNLVIRAASVLARRVGRELRIDAALTKRLPIGGGLGGGSSDAAAMLLGLAQLWGLDAADARVVDAAAAVGSDVPFFLGGGAMIATGRGTELAPHPRPFDGWAVLILPPFGTSTPKVYAACRPEPLGPDEAMPWDRPWSNAAELSARLRNDLLPAARSVEPALGLLHDRLNGLDGVRVHLSGSGSTMFALFDDPAIAGHWAGVAQAAGGHHVGANRLAAPEAEFRVVRVMSHPADSF